MRKCKYCGKDVGLFCRSHKECIEKHDIGVIRLKQILKDCFQQKTDFYLKETSVKKILADSYINDTEKQDIYVEVCDDAIDSYLNDGLINNQEKHTVARFIQFSALPQTVLNRNHSLEKLLQAEVLQDIVNCRIPTPKITISGSMPFMLGKDENLVWFFRNITIYEQKTKKEYAGRSQGFNIRICKGVYYRTGSFKGNPIETTYMHKIGSGNVCLTDKHIYISSPEKSFKIPYGKILNVDTYSNGIGLQKDSLNSKPIFLEGINSWFCYNVISNIKE